MYIAAAILCPPILGSLWAYAAAIVVDIIILVSAKSLKRAKNLIIFSFTIILTIFIIKGLFDAENATPAFAIGPAVFYKEGLMKALRTGAVIINMLLSFSILVLTSKPEDIADEMERHGFSPRLSYVISSVFSIIPQMMGTMDTITDAQRSRGMETEGSLGKRMKAFIPLITPVVTSSLINTRERAIALEVRGFGGKGKRSYLRTWQKHRGDKAMTISLAILIILASIWRVIVWLI